VLFCFCKTGRGLEPERPNSLWSFYCISAVFPFWQGESLDRKDGHLLSPPNKNGTQLGAIFVLSKPQAWHIIAARSVVYIIKGGEPPLYLITRQRASFLRLDDIQHFVLMICNSFGIDDIHACGVIPSK